MLRILSKANLKGISCTSKFKIYRCHQGIEGEYKYSSTLSLTSVLEVVSGESHARGVLLHRKTVRTDCTGGCVNFGVGLGGYEKYCPHRGFKPRPSSSKRVVISASSICERII